MLLVFRFLRSRVVVPFHYLGEVRLAIWTGQAAFVAVPLVLALVAEDDVALGRIHGRGSFVRGRRGVLREIKEGVRDRGLGDGAGEVSLIALAKAKCEVLARHS